MKFPKLKHTVLCQILLYLPGVSMFLWIAALALIPGTWKEHEALAIGGFILFCGVSLWYLFYYAAILISSDFLFSMIRQWKKDRTEYCTSRNGIGRTKIYKTVLRRCSLWGKRFRPQTNGMAETYVYYRHGYSWTVFWSMIEKRVAVYSVDVLTAEQYHLLTGQARWILNSVPDGKVRFKTKSERKAPLARAYVILILADTVDDEVKALARKSLVKTDESCILPCVIQCSDGCYYTDCTKECYMEGMTARPVRNFAADMIRRLVFARCLPKENRDSQPAPNFAYELDMSFWAYCKTMIDEMHGANDAMKKERTKAFRHMHNGETRVGDGAVWYKSENRLAEYTFLPDNEEEMLVTLIPDPVWYYQKDGGFLFRGSFNRRKMKKDEAERVQKYMEAKLIEEGYQITEI